MSLSRPTSFRDTLPADTFPLAFGTGALFSRRRTRREAMALLEAALDSGITYFDTARMYGAGRAETLIGELSAGKRDRLIVVSKAGIVPNSRSVAVRALGQGIRLLHKVVPPTAGRVPFPSTYQPRFGAFERSEFKRSVETSLRELRTDYLDALLLHECTIANCDMQALLPCLEEMKKEGKIRAFGIASGIDESIELLDRHPQLSQFVQIPSAIWNRNIERLRGKGCGFIVTHSSLTGRFNILFDRLKADAGMAAEWHAATDVDPRDASALSQLLLSHALYSNPDGMVIFFSSNPGNIVTNVERLKATRIDPKQIEALNELVGRGHVAAFLEASFRNLSF
jgi:D-threo-aldose 1-dehydrogenase